MLTKTNKKGFENFEGTAEVERGTGVKLEREKLGDPISAKFLKVIRESVSKKVFIGYGLARVFVEGFRQADPQFIGLENPMGYIIDLDNFGLTMGQTLSIPMVLIGFTIIYIARSRAE